MVEALKRDYRSAPISEQDKAMLDYVVKLTKDATKCSPEDHARLRAAGFDAFLIGERLMRETDPEAALRRLVTGDGA